MFQESILKMGELKLETEIENNQDSDSEICDIHEIDRLFINSCYIFEKVIAENKYILHVTATSENGPNVAIALSDNSCEIHTISNDQVANITTLTKHNDKIVDCRFSSRDSNMLYTGSSDGSVKLWDIRTPKEPAINFQDTTVENGNNTKMFSCFDISSNERLLTAGTDLSEGDAFLLFWDMRSRNLLGGYWESHTDDITQVKFHPHDTNKLISGSVDGLINVYDLSQSCEDNALIDTLNTESSIEQLLWFNENGKDNIGCITHTADLQLWNVEGAEPYKHISRADIAKTIRKFCNLKKCQEQREIVENPVGILRQAPVSLFIKKSQDYIYLTKVHNADNYLLVLAGSNYNDGECIRGIQIKNGQTQPAVGFKENKQRVRSSWYNENTNMLLTGGEKGILNVWRLTSIKNNSFPVKKIR
ncbi:hypothetical protein NQ314_020557 [Rhamnusium bicolor]|uniref:WD repeat-containing protein 89 n=1 Tax=Rhamnusium bicolor TaxID=1586634 RepID=A0AAV8WMU2_9CUCU|nr:hypothetical protein NQ314_020557 [Rhamnusium bicolor]